MEGCKARWSLPMPFSLMCTHTFFKLSNPRLWKKALQKIPVCPFDTAQKDQWLFFFGFFSSTETVKNSFITALWIKKFDLEIQEVALIVSLSEAIKSHRVSVEVAVSPCVQLPLEEDV